MKKRQTVLVFTLSLLVMGHCTFAQKAPETGLVSYYLHIQPKQYSDSDILGFELYLRPKRNQAAWTSPLLTPLQQDSLGYLVKVDIPPELVTQIKMLRCTAFSLRSREGMATDTVGFSDGGVRLSSIRLTILSDPSGAEVYLIPNRIWQSKIEKLNWQKDPSLLGDFRVSTSLTETYTYIDQTVFKVVFRLGDQFQTLTHNPRSPAVEPEQQISVQFQP